MSYSSTWELRSTKLRAFFLFSNKQAKENFRRLKIVTKRVAASQGVNRQPNGKGWGRDRERRSRDRQGQTQKTSSVPEPPSTA